MVKREILKGGGGGGNNFYILFKRIVFFFFFGKNNLKLIEKQEKALGVRGHAPSEKFCKFTCCNGYFSAF